MPWFVAIAVVEAGIAIYGQVKSASDQAAAAEKDAANKRAQANEVDRRTTQQTIEMRSQEHGLEGEQISGYAKGGVELEGSPLLAMESTHANNEQQIFEMQREDAFRAAQLRAGGDAQDVSAQDHQVSGYVNAGGTVLTTASSIYANSSSGSKASTNNASKDIYGNQGTTYA